MYSTAFFLRHVLWLCFCLWDVGPAPGISHSHRARSHATKPCYVRTAPGDTTSSRARTLIGRLGRAVVDRVSERRVAFAVRRSDHRYTTRCRPPTRKRVALAFGGSFAPSGLDVPTYGDNLGSTETPCCTTAKAFTLCLGWRSRRVHTSDRP